MSWEGELILTPFPFILLINKGDYFMTGFDFYIGACLGILALNALRQMFIKNS